MLLTGQVGVNQLSGPVGIVDVVNDTYDAAAPSGWSAVILSMMNLGINLSQLRGAELASDPGAGRRTSGIPFNRGGEKETDCAGKEGMVHFIGFAALMALMVFVMYNDIMRLF